MRISDWSSDVCSSDLLLRELAQDGAVFAHDAFSHLHLRGQLGIERGQANAVGGFQRVQFIALVQAQAGQQFLGQDDASGVADGGDLERSEEHTSELQSLMRISYAVFCLKKKKKQ